MEILALLCTAAQTGNAIDAETSATIHQNRVQIETISPNSLRIQLTEILCGKAVEMVLREFADVLAVVLPEIRPMFGLAQKNPHHDRDVWEHTLAVVSAAPATPVMRWAALLHDIGKPSCFSISPDGIGHFYGHAPKSMEMASNLLSRLYFAEKEQETILTLIRYHDLPLSPERKALSRLLRKLGEDRLRQLIALHQADTHGQSAICQYRIAEYQQVEGVLADILAEEKSFSLRDLQINGYDLMDLGLSGPEIGTGLQRCFQAVCAGKIPNQRESLLEYLNKTGSDD